MDVLRIGTACGVAAFALTLMSISVAGADACAIHVTPLKNGSLFVTGQFHSASEDDRLDDLTYISTDNVGRHTLSILLADGAGKFSSLHSPIPSIVLSDPRVMAAGRFRNNASLDLAVADLEFDALTGAKRPILKILVREGEGPSSRFKPQDGTFRFLLEPGEIPVAMVTGHFKDGVADGPLDIAIVSEVTSSGKLTIFFNDGQGKFFEQRSIGLPFRPGAASASSKLTADGKYHFVIRDADHNRFMFLLNEGGGQFTGKPFFEGAGEVDWLLIGNITDDVSSDPNSDFNNIHDIITIDNDMTVRVFANDRSGNFIKEDPLTVLGGRFRLAGSRFFLEEVDGGKLGLAAAVIRPDGNMGVLTIARKEDPNRHFVMWGEPSVSEVKPPTDPKPIMDENLQRALVAERIVTSYELPETMPSERITDSLVNSAIGGQFVSSLLGNNKRDLGFLVRVTAEGLVADACSPSDPPTRPPSTNVDTIVQCTCPSGEEGGAGLRCPAPPDNSFPGECGVPGQRCPPERPPDPTCTSHQVTRIIPLTKAFCASRRVYSYLLVFGGC
jgi:hypothetical protein